MINRDELLKMAREAGFCMDCDWKAASDYLCDECDIISFANAILERAAVECENARLTISEFHDDDVKEAGINTCVNLASRIRALKTQGE